MANFWNLREANVARDIEWTGGTEVSYTFRATELHGECGEVIDLFINPEAGEHAAGEGGEMASMAWLDMLREELADGFITVDLVGMKLGFPHIPTDPETALPEMLTSYESHPNTELFALLGRSTGAVCNTLKKLEREALGFPGSRAKATDAWVPLFEVHCILRTLAGRYGMEPDSIIAAKFNRTSEKVGLTTRLIA